MKLNPPNAHRSQIKICEKRQTRNVQFRFMPNAFRILKPIQKSSKCVWVFRSTGANAVAKNQTRLAYEDKRDLYCIVSMMSYLVTNLIKLKSVWTWSNQSLSIQEGHCNYLSQLSRKDWRNVTFGKVGIRFLKINRISSLGSRIWALLSSIYMNDS